MTSDEEKVQADIVSELLAPIPRTAIVPAVRAALGLSQRVTDQIVQAFDDFVARPLAENLTRLHGRDLAKRNPMIYTVRGVETVEEWADQVLKDKETSAIEGHIGTWLEEVARLVSGGIKPGSGVDLQVTDTDGTVQLYAIQSSPNTKNAGGRRSDIEALRRGARPLRGHRQRVELNIAVLAGRAKTERMREHSDITVLRSDDFWERVSGIPDFRARLVRATTILAWLVKRRSADEVLRIKREAIELFADADGRLDLEAIANPPRTAREERQFLEGRLLARAGLLSADE
ncbi:MAG TPA: PmeII family type II restriction endonuclease [Gemmatimonadaceae bacterium]|nr:PmeII family type II restriction endonuclease [Gemmatimonadaceae bacterium]